MDKVLHPSPQITRGNSLQCSYPDLSVPEGTVRRSANVFIYLTVHTLSSYVPAECDITQRQINTGAAIRPIDEGRGLSGQLLCPLGGVSVPQQTA